MARPSDGRIPPQLLLFLQGNAIHAVIAGPHLEDGVTFVPPPDIEDIEPATVQFPIQPGE